MLRWYYFVHLNSWVFSECHNQKQHIMIDLTMHKVIETAGEETYLVGCFCISIQHKKRHVPGKYKSTKKKKKKDPLTIQ